MGNTFNIPQRVKEIRKKMNLSQTEFGKLLGYDGRFPVADWETGRTIPRADMWERMKEIEPQTAKAQKSRKG